MFGSKELSKYTESDKSATTQNIYDAALSVPQVLTESTESNKITYEYGLERIAAYNTGSDAVKTQYVHDAGGNVVQTVSSKITEDLSLDSTSPEVKSYSYTPFGVQLGESVSGYAYGGEYYDASAGMLDLRARWYEPTAMRFNQRDIISGNIGDSITLNRYVYCHNNPISFSDPMGTSIISKLKSTAKSAVKSVKSAATAVTSKVVSTAAKVTSQAAKVVSKASTTVVKASTTVAKVAQNVASNSNNKVVKSIAGAVSSGANKVATVATKTATAAAKVASVSDQVAKTYDKKAEDAWKDAKKNFAANEIFEGNKSISKKTTCSRNNNSNTIESNSALDRIKDYFTKIGSDISSFAQNTFGAGSSFVKEDKYAKTVYLPDWFIISAKNEIKNTTTIRSSGNSNKPISVYARGVASNTNMELGGLSSSVGLLLNFNSSSIDLSLGADNIGISYRYKENDELKSGGIRISLVELKVGVEWSITTKISENKSTTDLYNVSISGWLLLVAYVYSQTGYWQSSPQTSPANINSNII